MKTALQHLNLLEGVLAWLEDNGNTLLAAGESFIDALENAQEVLESVYAYMDTYTDGYHLGAYSQVRQDLHMCVGYAGHNTYAQLATGNIGDHTVAAGATYKSFNLVEKHRVQFRSGGLGASFDDLVLQLAPGMEINTQMDGFRMWNKYYPFGIGAPSSVMWGGDINNPSFNTSQVGDVDMFNLVDEDILEQLCPGDVGPCDLTWTSFIYTGFFPIDYPNPADTYVWPRNLVWENDLRVASVFGMGLNMHPKTKVYVYELPPGGIPLWPGVMLQPWLSVQAGAFWTYAANRERDTLQAALNQNLPEADQLGPDDFERHAIPLTGDAALDGEHFQAADVTEDVGHGAGVYPKIGADLDVGLQISKWLKNRDYGGNQLWNRPGGLGAGGCARLESCADRSSPGEQSARGRLLSGDRQQRTKHLLQLGVSRGDCVAGATCSTDADCHPSQECVEGNCSPDCVDLTPQDSDELTSSGNYTCTGDSPSCVNHGYCIVDGQIIAHDVTQAECEGVEFEPNPNGGKCIALFGPDNWNPTGSGTDIVPEEWAVNGAGTGGAPITFNSSHLTASEVATWQEYNLGSAQSLASAYDTADVCQKHGWCLNWVQIRWAPICSRLPERIFWISFSPP